MKENSELELGARTDALRGSTISIAKEAA